MNDRQPYEIDLTRSARRAIAETLPLDVAIGVSDFITGPLADNPRRVGKELDAPLRGVYSARHAGIARPVRHRRQRASSVGALG